MPGSFPLRQVEQFHLADCVAARLASAAWNVLMPEEWAKCYDGNRLHSVAAQPESLQPHPPYLYSLTHLEVFHTQACAFRQFLIPCARSPMPKGFFFPLLFHNMLQNRTEPHGNFLFERGGKIRRKRLVCMEIALF